MSPGSRAHMIHGQPARATLHLPTVAQAEADLAAHLAKCPGTHLECYGHPAKERDRMRWIDTKHHLQAVLDMAREAESSGWRDGKGKHVKPMPWKANGTLETPEPSAKAKEMKAYRERVKAGTVGKPGRPKVKAA